jgi:hypothetical protein
MLQNNARRGKRSIIGYSFFNKIFTGLSGVFRYFSEYSHTL